jgi:D-alanine-D-alanine ligase
MEIVVLGGGNSTEREVSLRSAKAVTDAAIEAGFNVREVDPAGGLFFLDSLSSSSIVLPILHGEGGEDGTIQTELEKRNIPYLGSNSESSAKCIDKWQTRQILESAGLPVARGDFVNKEKYEAHELAKIPHVLKVMHGGSSIGTLIVRDPKGTDDTFVSELFRLEQEAVIEELIEGIETTVSILDQSALIPLEIIPPEGAEFDYDNKYNGKTQEICPPVNISEDLQAKCKTLSEQVHKTMGCRHLSRVDIIIRPDGSLVVLEINTIPGLTGQSLYPKSAAASGLNMPALVTKFVEMVKRDYSL